jgi:uncharacterized protein
VRSPGPSGQEPSLGDTSVLNGRFPVAAALLVWRFVRSGGPAMLRMMKRPPDGMIHHPEHQHAHGG